MSKRDTFRSTVNRKHAEMCDGQWTERVRNPNPWYRQDMPEQALTPRQQTFARTIAAGNVSQTQAARLAGYAESSAHVAATTLMRNPKVKNEVDRLTSRRRDKASEAEDVLDRLVAQLRTMEVPSDPALLLPSIDKLVDIASKLQAFDTGDRQGLEDRAADHRDYVKRVVAWTLQQVGKGRIERLARWTGVEQALDTAPGESDNVSPPPETAE